MRFLLALLVLFVLTTADASAQYRRDHPPAHAWMDPIPGHSAGPQYANTPLYPRLGYQQEADYGRYRCPPAYIYQPVYYVQPVYYYAEPVYGWYGGVPFRR